MPSFFRRLMSRMFKEKVTSKTSSSNRSKKAITTSQNAKPPRTQLTQVNLAGKPPPEGQSHEEEEQPEKFFWEQAAATLDTEVQKALYEISTAPDSLRNEAQKQSPANTKPPSFAELVSEGIKKRIDDIDNREWALPFDIKLRKEEIRRCFQKFYDVAKVIKDNGDGLVGCDPTGYARAGWLPFCIIMNLTTSEIEQHAAALETFSSISLLIHKYEKIEGVYQKREKDKVFEQCVVELYSKILECEVMLVHYLKRNGFVKFLRAIPALDGWVDMKEIIDDLDSRCQTLLDIADSEDILAMKQNTDELTDDKRRKETMVILHWITEHDASAQRNLAIEKAKLNNAHRGAGQWLISNDRTFQNWLSLVPGSQPSETQHGLRVLWLHGPVGCGKTTLTTQVLEHFLRSASSKLESEQVAYFYCVKDQGSTAVDIFRSLVRQLAWSPVDGKIEKDLKDYWKRLSSPGNRLSLEQCENWLLQFTGRCRITTIIIDALDECGERLELQKALKSLSSRLREKKFSIKLFLSGRDEVRADLEVFKPDEINITREKTEHDLHKFIERTVEAQCDRLPGLRSEEHSGLRRRLIDELTEKGKLAFRWTELQLALFFPPQLIVFNPVEIEDRLKGLEERVGVTDLNNTYREIYNRAARSEAVKKHLVLALKWALVCKERLRVDLLVEAVKFESARSADTFQPPKPTSYIDKEYLLNLTSNLLAMDDHSILHFAHASVKEFLQVDREFSMAFSNVSANTAIAVSCVYYTLSNGTDSLCAPYFSMYASKFWPWHCAKAGEAARLETPLKEPFELLVLEYPVGIAFQRWLKFCEISLGIGFRPERPNPVYFSAAISEPPSPFFAACIWNLPEVLNICLQRDPGIVKARNTDRKTGLYLAAQRGHTTVVRRLLDPKALVKAEVNAGGASGKTALHAAAKTGHIETVLALLEEPEIDINAGFGESMRTALQVAVRFNKVQIVAQLISRGANVNTLLPRTDSALHCAVRFDRSGLVDVLLKARDIDVNAADGKGFVPLYVAVSNGNAQMVRQLLEHGAGIQAQVGTEDHDGNAEVEWKARNQSFATLVEIVLCKSNVDLNARDVLARTALHWAAIDGSIEATRLLVARGADINLRDYQQASALCLAARRTGSSTLWAIFIMKVLLGAHKIDVNLSDDSGKTALHWVVMHGTLHAVELTRLLIKKRADVNLRDFEGSTALSLAIRRDGDSVRTTGLMKALLDAPEINVNIRDNCGKTALHWLMMHQNIYISLDVLLDAPGIDVNLRDNAGQTVLHYAVMRKAYQAIYKLLELGGNANVQDLQGRTPLHLAIEFHKKSPVRQLLEFPGIDLNLRENEHGWTALHKAAHDGAWAVCEVLLRAGANIEAETLREVQQLAKDTQDSGDPREDTARAAVIRLLEDRISAAETIREGEICTGE